MNTSEKFTLAELNDMCQIMNCWSPDDCPVCASARVKLEAMIVQEQKRPVKEIQEIAGHTVTVERSW